MLAQPLLEIAKMLTERAGIHEKLTAFLATHLKHSLAPIRLGFPTFLDGTRPGPGSLKVLMPLDVRSAPKEPGGVRQALFGVEGEIPLQVGRRAPAR